MKERLTKSMLFFMLSPQSWGKHPLTAAPSWQKRSAGIWETAGSAPRSTQTGCSRLACSRRSTLPRAARLFGLAREALCSPLKWESLLPFWVHKVSTNVPFTGAWPPALPGCVSSQCGWQLPLVLSNQAFHHQDSLPLQGFKETPPRLLIKALQACFFPAPGRQPG